ETGFYNYFSPPPVGQNYYMPNYFYPQAYPQPPPVYALPPLPPPRLFTHLLLLNNSVPLPPILLPTTPTVDFQPQPQVACKRSVARNERTQDDYEGTATRREDDDGHSGRRADEVATTPASAAGVAPAARRQREKGGKIGRNS
ncbi:hypothetical protein MTO96_046851, partial [Rhipicephalus appendiculatus]